jgi:SAM-dependent methyltransferase
MGKAERKKGGRASSTPYSKPSSKGLASAGSTIFKFNTDIGQHILKNGAIADNIVDKANVQPTQTVLEVGPGPGILTSRILDKAKKVIAVELDPRMAAELTKRFQGTPQEKKLQIVLGDFIKTDLSKLPPFQAVISNTPYQVCLPSFFSLDRDRFRGALVQCGRANRLSVTDLLPPNFQTPLHAEPPQNVRAHGPTRIRTPPNRPPRRRPLLTPLRQRPILLQSLAHHESRPQQFPPAAASRIERRPRRAETAAPGYQLGRMGWDAPDLFRQEE